MFTVRQREMISVRSYKQQQNNKSQYNLGKVTTVFTKLFFYEWLNQKCGKSKHIPKEFSSVV